MTETDDCPLVLVETTAKSSVGMWAHVVTVALWLDECLETRRQRRALLMMDNHMLKDVGLTRADVDSEASRSFWDIGKL
jgi:uncharacterized protein YjiS (DUF1127 family)